MDAYYSIEVSVGLPAADTKKFGDVYQPEQMFSLTLTSDVGMPNPWIPSVQCKLCCNPGNVWYDKQKSTVFNSTNTYANDTLSGEYGTDRLTVSRTLTRSRLSLIASQPGSESGPTGQSKSRISRPIVFATDPMAVLQNSWIEILNLPDGGEWRKLRLLDIPIPRALPFQDFGVSKLKH